MPERTGEPTEEPTPRRLAEARREGIVGVSRELLAVAAFIGAAGALAASAATSWPMVRSYLTGELAAVGAPFSAGRPLGWALAVGATVLVGPLAAAFGAVTVVGLLQTGGFFGAAPLRPDPARLWPASGLGRLLRAEAAPEMAVGIAKILAVATAAWWTLQPVAGDVLRLSGVPAEAVLGAIVVLLGKLAPRLAVVLALVAISDWVWRRVRRLRSLRMTRLELRREQRLTEGDLVHRAERRRRHREAMGDWGGVEGADVVVLGAEPVAFAIRHDPGTRAAPAIAAKGRRLAARRIELGARRAGVAVRRDESLARALDALEEGDEIPEALYEVVAETLRAVRRASRR